MKKNTEGDENELTMMSLTKIPIFHTFNKIEKNFAPIKNKYFLDISFCVLLLVCHAAYVANL